MQESNNHLASLPLKALHIEFVIAALDPTRHSGDNNVLLHVNGVDNSDEPIGAGFSCWC